MDRIRISIIIPAYNEERHLSRCLDSIARQSVQPHEVIVVDNNSTDTTAAIAATYPFVRLLHEPEPGLIPARNTGFAAASGTVLARINADVVLQDGWLAAVQLGFADRHCMAVTGPAHTKLLPRGLSLYTTFWSRIYFQAAGLFLGAPVVWGANMALRRTAWRQIKAETHAEADHIHEDQDISLCLAGLGYTVNRPGGMVVWTDEESYLDWPKLQDYLHRAADTKAMHRAAGTYRQASFRGLAAGRRAAAVWVAVPAAVFCLMGYGLYQLRRLPLRRR